MPYILKLDKVVQDQWDQLKAPADLDLTIAMIAVCEDPLGATVPYGYDDGVMRMLVRPSVMAVILLNHTLGHVRLLQVTALS